MATKDDFSSDVSTTGRIINGYASGVSNYSGDKDWFKVDLVAGTRYIFYTSFYDLESTSVSAVLRDASGEPVNDIFTSYYDINADQQFYYHNFTPTKSGRYYLEVKDTTLSEFFDSSD
jgi:hypothetical protein